MAENQRPKGKGGLRELATEIAEATDTDLLLYNAPVERHLDQRVLELCAARSRRKKVALLLVTEGGSADVAYRIAACLQANYERFVVLVPGFCKSAGTLIALGAHEVAMSPNGELGPLDVQLSKKDELLETRSGLTATSALRTLNQQAFQAFRFFLFETVRDSMGAISTNTAAEIASRLACGLFTPVYGQVDPMHIGEAGRALTIARDYGRRLATVADNLQDPLESTLDRLVADYPSHGFVIDFREAEQLFKNVRWFTPEEATLAECLGTIGRWPGQDQKDRYVGFLSAEPKKKKPARKKRSAKDARQEEPRSAAKAGEGTRDVAASRGNGKPKLPEAAGERAAKRP